MNTTAMRVSSRMITGDQERWLTVDRVIDRPAAVRVHVGTFFEEASLALFGGHRHQIDSSAAVCPDLSVGPNQFLEIKSIGQSRQGLVYKDRLAKDRRLLRQTGGGLCYVFWVHNVEATMCKSLGELRAKLTKGVEVVLCIPFERLWRACRKLRATVCNYRTAARGAPDVPMVAYRLPWRLLLRLAGDPRRQVWHAPDFTIHGLTVSGVTVRGCNIGRCLAPLTESERETAQWMADQLRHERLDVVLAPAPDSRHHGHAVRVVQGRNPEWYRDLCQSRTSKRKRARSRLHDTAIQRRCVLPALKRIARGEVRFGYDFLCLPYVRHLAVAA